MAQYDVHQSRSGANLLLDVQADLLDHLNTRIVVPLMPKARAPLPAARLNPVFDIDARPFVMVTQFLATVPRHELGPVVTSLDPHHDHVTAALDMIFHGF